jgi:hypothetical protein
MNQEEVNSHLIRKVDSILIALGGDEKTGQRGISQEIGDFKKDFQSHTLADETQFAKIDRTISRAYGMTAAITIIWIVLTTIAGIVMAVYKT